MLDADELRRWVSDRVGSKRFQHIVGVVDVARKLATRHGVDPERAAAAAWLHDACKEIKDSQLLAEAGKYNLEITEVEQDTPHLLHGPVAAAVVREKFNINDEDLLAAIAEHTLGNVPMTPLSEIIFLADCLEDSRPKDYTACIWEAVDPNGQFNINKGMLAACDLNILHLLKEGRVIHPRTVQVRNHYLKRTRA